MGVGDHLSEDMLKAVGEKVALTVFDDVVTPVVQGLVKDTENAIDDAMANLLLPLVREQLAKIHTPAEPVPA